MSKRRVRAQAHAGERCPVTGSARTGRKLLSRSMLWWCGKHTGTVGYKYVLARLKIRFLSPLRCHACRLSTALRIRKIRASACCKENKKVGPPEELGCRLSRPPAHPPRAFVSPSFGWSSRSSGQLITWEYALCYYCCCCYCCCRREINPTLQFSSDYTTGSDAY